MLSDVFFRHIHQYRPTLYIGCMTGTSADKFADFTLACFSSEGDLRFHANQAILIPPTLQRSLRHLSEECQSNASSVAMMQTEAKLTHFLARAFLEAIAKWKLSEYPKTKIILSPHGQTVYHNPQEKQTHQLCDGMLLHNLTGYPVAHGHRQACIKVSNAAPLAPVLLQEIFKASEQRLLIINGGGIANLTVIEEGNGTITGFDTGPANGPLDSLIQHAIDHGDPSLNEQIRRDGFDHNGAVAKKGRLIPQLFNRLINSSFFSRPHNEKSADRSEFNLNWIGTEAINQNTLADLLHTTASVVATSITNAIRQHTTRLTTNHVFFYGGMCHNGFVMDLICNSLNPHKHIQVKSLHQLGFDVDFIESLLMAYLGYCVQTQRHIDLRYCSTMTSATCIPGFFISTRKETENAK